LKSHKFLFFAKDGIELLLICYGAGLSLLLPFIGNNNVFAPMMRIILGLIWIMLGLFLTWFFRDPDRKIPVDENALVSPADGRVIEVIDSVKADDIEHLKGKVFKKLSIFMSVVSVHVNRAPWAGKVKLVQHRKGQFYPADKVEASERNESNYVLIEDEKTSDQILVKQIAGILARRIVCWVKEGDFVVKGARFGMIKLGSRVEIFIPSNFAFTVRPGEKVKAGLTVIGRKT
jgi:phosphatidylserine decarboxylase